MVDCCQTFKLLLFILCYKTYGNKYLINANLSVGVCVYIYVVMYLLYFQMKSIAMHSKVREKLVLVKFPPNVEFAVCSLSWITFYYYN